jgi:hypothetical protein
VALGEPFQLAFYQRLGFANAGDPPEVWNHMILRRGSIDLHFDLAALVLDRN